MIRKNKSLRLTVTWVTMLLTVTINRVAAQNYSPEEYIDTFKEAAIQHMEVHGCPASVILAVAMHESANGNSKIARHLNNHFGIKGKNNSKTIRSAYKEYGSVEDSFQDFIAYLKKRKGTQQLFTAYAADDHQNWVKGIARAGYAASPAWANKVLSTIRKYDLHQFDKTFLNEGDSVGYAADERWSAATVYIVKKGDTLSAIARKHGTTVKTIRQKNSLANTRLQIGQQLTL